MAIIPIVDVCVCDSLSASRVQFKIEMKFKFRLALPRPTRRRADDDYDGSLSVLTIVQSSLSSHYLVFGLPVRIDIHIYHDSFELSDKLVRPSAASTLTSNYNVSCARMKVPCSLDKYLKRMELIIKKLVGFPDKKL